MGVSKSIDIPPDQQRPVLDLPNTVAWGCGSRAKGTARPQFDLDRVVFATPEVSMQVGDLREAFEESNLLFRVDLFPWNAVPASFQKNIESSHVVLSSE